MNLTYIIGNGFDIGLGLKTSYQEFLKCYLCENFHSGDFPGVQTLKKIINRDRKTWGDAEREFGRIDYCEFDENGTLASYATSAYGNFCSYLHEYIKLQESIVPETVDDDISSKFRSLLLLLSCEITRLMSSDEGDGFLRNACSIHLNFINFNYTNTLKKMIGRVPDVTTLRVGGKNVGAYFYEQFHVHGEVSRQEGEKSSSNTVDIVFGIGDTSQFTGLPCKDYGMEFEQLLQLLIKKDSVNANRKGTVVYKAKNALWASDCIVLFGVSIGETDCFWWNTIFCILKSNPNVKLAYVPFHDDCPIGVDIKSLEARERCYVAEKFAKSIHEQKEDILRQIGNQILVVGPGPNEDYDGKFHFYDQLHLKWFKNALGII